MRSPFSSPDPFERDLGADHKDRGLWTRMMLPLASQFSLQNSELGDLLMIMFCKGRRRLCNILKSFV